jgi:hypothetical protein
VTYVRYRTRSIRLLAVAEQVGVSRKEKKLNFIRGLGWIGSEDDGWIGLSVFGI